GRLDDRGISDAANPAAPTQGDPRRHGKAALGEDRVHDVLSKAQRRRVARAASIWYAEQLQDGDDGRFELGHTVDPLTHVERDIELAALQPFDPTAFERHWNANDAIALVLQRCLDR